MLFKKRKRFYIMHLDLGGYYIGFQPGSDSVWTPVEDDAKRFTEADAYEAAKAMVIHRMVGSASFVVLED